jgi:hypothetical protein
VIKRRGNLCSVAEIVRNAEDVIDLKCHEVAIRGYEQVVKRIANIRFDLYRKI